MHWHGALRPNSRVGNKEAKAAQAISYINSASNGTTNGSSITVNKPTNTSDGDLMIAVGVIEDASRGINPPSGWTQIINNQLGTRAHRQYVWYKVASSEGASYNFTTSDSTADEFAVGIATFRYATIGNYSSQDNNSSTTTNTAPSINIQNANNWGLHIGSAMYGTTRTGPTGWTEVIDYRTGTGSGNIMLAMSYYQYPSAGNTGTKDATLANADYNIGTQVELVQQITTLGNGTDPSSSTVGPGTTNYLDQFSFVTNSGTDTVTGLTVTTTNTSAIASMKICSNDDSCTTQYFNTVTSPSGDNWSFSGGTSIPVTTTTSSYRVVFTAKDHSSLAEGTYAVTGYVSAFTCSNTQAGIDSAGTTITIDNAPPANATWGTITPGDQQVALNWSNPGSDFYKVLILRKAGSAITDAPTEGTEYSAPGTIGDSTIIYVNNGSSFTDTGLTNGTNYYYKIFAYDQYKNYASGAGTGPHQPFAPSISITISDGTVEYGIVPKNTAKTTLSSDMPPSGDMQTVNYDTNVTVNINIKGNNASGGGCTWTLASSNGADQYVHQFCNATDNNCSSPPTNYTALTTNYQTLKSGVSGQGSVNFHLRLITPTESSCYGQQSVNVDVQAVQP